MKLKPKIKLGDVFTIVIIIISVMLLSLILNAIGFEGAKTSIVNRNLETSLVTINNIFTIEGMKFLFGNFLTNVRIFEPLIMLIASLIGMGIVEKSGILKFIGEKIKKIDIKIIIFLTIIISMMSLFFGEYSYLILIPLCSLLYKEMGKSPILGAITVFLGMTLGYGTSIFINYNDYILGVMTELAATIDVDKNYKFIASSTSYIGIISSIILAILLTILIDKKLLKKLNKKQKEIVTDIEIIEEEPNYKKAFLISSIFLVIYIIISIIFMIPRNPLSEIFLDMSGTNYIMKLFSEASGFKEGFYFITLFGIIVTSFIYGKISKNINSLEDANKSFSEHFNKIGHLFVLIFLISNLIAILNWTNIGEVFAVKIIDFISRLEFSGLPLIIILFISTLIVGIVIPSTFVKWSLFSPLTVPLFMRSNITPDFTQFVFKAADGVSKSLTPIFPYFIILIGYINKYDEENNFSVFSTLKLMLPLILFVILVWIVILCGFYIIGLPIGPNTVTTL